MVNSKAITVHTYQKEKSGNMHCGDNYYYFETSEGFICIVVDGLGSGKMASDSAEAAVNVIKDNVHIDNNTFVKKCVEALEGLRGVVLGILRIDFKTRIYTYSSIGNIGLIIIKDKDHRQRKRVIPSLGFLGGYDRKLKVVQGIVEKNMRFLMFTDGVKDKELSDVCLCVKHVREIIQTYSSVSSNERDDDTTLIAMEYVGKDGKADS